jgi:hypothetical protein
MTARLPPSRRTLTTRRQNSPRRGAASSCLVSFVLSSILGPSGPSCTSRMSKVLRPGRTGTHPRHAKRTELDEKMPTRPPIASTMSHRVPGPAKAHDVVLQVWHAVISGGWAGLGPAPPHIRWGLSKSRVIRAPVEQHQAATHSNQAMASIGQAICPRHLSLLSLSQAYGRRGNAT